MLVELSTVGFAPLGSYWSPLVRKRLFWTSSGCSYAHRGLSWSPAESSRVLRSLQESSGVLRSSQECCGVLRSPQESLGVLRSLRESSWILWSLKESCEILCNLWGSKVYQKNQYFHKIFFPIKKLYFRDFLSKNSVILISKSSFALDVIFGISRVGFAPLGSYWSPLVRKRLFWAS